jgi:hypothetical protein
MLGNGAVYSSTMPDAGTGYVSPRTIRWEYMGNSFMDLSV